jgi:hypothetical protein
VDAGEVNNKSNQYLLGRWERVQQIVTRAARGKHGLLVNVTLSLMKIV